MLTEWQRVFMHDNRDRVESLTNQSDLYIDRLLDGLEKYNDTSEQTKEYRKRALNMLKSLNEKLRSNLSEFEAAMMRGNNMHNTPDPEFSYTPDDYMREDK